MSGRGVLDADMTTVGVWLADGLRWWGDQLRAILPRSLRSPDPHAAAILLASGHEGQVIDPASLFGIAGKTLALPAGLCLVRRIERPVASERDYERMVALEADRLMPLGREGTIVAARVIGQGSIPQTAALAVAGLPRISAVSLCAQLRSGSGLPSTLLASAPTPANPAPVDMLPALRRAGLLPDERMATARWWLVALFLVALNLGLLVWRDMAATDTLQQFVSDQQPALSAAQRLRARIAGDARIVARTREARSTREPLAVLVRVGSALPPGAWLKSYAWQGNQVRLAGFRPATADVAAGLRQAGFSSVRNDEGPSSAATALGQPFQIVAGLRKAK